MSMSKWVILLFSIVVLISCSEDSSSTKDSSVRDKPDIEIPSSNGSFSLASETFKLNSNEENFRSEDVLYANNISYTWSLSKNVNFGTVNIIKEDNNLKFDYTPNLTITNVEDSFEIKIRFVEDGLLKEKNYTIKVIIGEINSGNDNSDDSSGEENNQEDNYTIEWTTLINRSNKNSFNQKIISSSYNKSFSYELIKDVCSGSAFLNRNGNDLFLSYSPSLSGTESLKLKVIQEKDNGDFIEEEKEILISIEGVSAVRSCETNNDENSNGGGGDNNDEVVSEPEEYHSWNIEHFYYNYDISQNLFFTSTFQNFFSYEITEFPCKGDLSITKIDNKLYFNYDPEDNHNGSESFKIKIRQKRSENVDLIVEKEIKINVLQSGEVNKSCLDSGSDDDNSDPDDSGGNSDSYSNTIILNNPINLESFDSQSIIIAKNDYELSNYTFKILENPCKGEFSVNNIGRDLILNYDPLDNFYGTQSFKIEYTFYNEQSSLEKQEINYLINIFGESTVDRSCDSESEGEDSEDNTGGGVVGGNGSDGGSGSAGDSCDPLVVADCDDGVTDNPQEIVDLGYQFTFNESFSVGQNITYQGSFGIGTPPGDLDRTIIEQPKKGVIQFLSDLDKYVYIPYTNHVGDDTFKINFSPNYGEFNGGTKTFYVKIVSSRDSLDFNYIGFTSSPEYINIINENDSKTDIILNKNNFLIGFNKFNDHFSSIKPETLSCPEITSYYYIKIFGDSEVYNQNLDYNGLWNCEYNIASLNQEKIILNSSNYSLLGEDNSIYLGIKKSNNLNQTDSYLNYNYNSYSLKRLFINNESNDELNLNQSLILSINAINYLNLGNGYYTKIFKNYYGGYDLIDIYSYNDGILNLIENNSLYGSMIIIDGVFYIGLEKYKVSTEDKGQTILIIESN